MCICQKQGQSRFYLAATERVLRTRPISAAENMPKKYNKLNFYIF
jgi:hypothetical protein